MFSDYFGNFILTSLVIQSMYCLMLFWCLQIVSISTSCNGAGGGEQANRRIMENLPVL